MLRCAILASVLASACPASAEAVFEGPNRLSIRCHDVRLYPNGTVESDEEAAPVDLEKKGSFADATFGPHVFSSGRVDIGEWVNRSCAKK